MTDFYSNIGKLRFSLPMRLSLLVLAVLFLLGFSSYAMSEKFTTDLDGGQFLCGNEFLSQFCKEAVGSAEFSVYEKTGEEIKVGSQKSGKGAAVIKSSRPLASKYSLSYDFYVDSASSSDFTTCYPLGITNSSRIGITSREQVGLPKLAVQVLYNRIYVSISPDPNKSEQRLYLTPSGKWTSENIPVLLHASDHWFYVWFAKLDGHYALKLESDKGRLICQAEIQFDKIKEDPNIQSSWFAGDPFDDDQENLHGSVKLRNIAYQELDKKLPFCATIELEKYLFAGQNNTSIEIINSSKKPLNFSCEVLIQPIDKPETCLVDKKVFDFKSEATERFEIPLKLDREDNSYRSQIRLIYEDGYSQILYLPVLKPYCWTANRTSLEKELEYQSSAYKSIQNQFSRWGGYPIAIRTWLRLWFEKYQENNSAYNKLKEEMGLNSDVRGKLVEQLENIIIRVQREAISIRKMQQYSMFNILNNEATFGVAYDLTMDKINQNLSPKLLITDYFHQDYVLGGETIWATKGKANFELPIRFSAYAGHQNMFSILILPFGNDLRGINVTFSDLNTKDGSNLIGKQCWSAVVKRPYDEVSRMGKWSGNNATDFNVPADRIQDVWVRLDCPADVKVGKYFGRIEVSDSKGESRFVPVVLEVLALPQSAKNFFPLGVWVLGGSDLEQLGRILFKDIRNHGLNTIWWAEYQPRQAPLLHSLAEQEGFKFVLSGHLNAEVINDKLPALSYRGELLTEDDVFANIKKMVDEYRGSETLLGYATYSEPELSFAKSLGIINRISDGLDPAHPSLIILHQAGTLDSFSNVSNLSVLVHDNYEEIDILAVQLQQAARVAQKYDVPLWAMLSSTTTDNTVPAETEALKVRTRTYIALASGAKGIFYWWYQSMTDPVWAGFVDTQLGSTVKWDAMTDLAGEVSKLATVLLNLKLADNIAKISDEGVVTTLRDDQGTVYIGIVNTDITRDITYKLDVTPQFARAENLLTKQQYPFDKGMTSIAIPAGYGAILRLEK